MSSVMDPGAKKACGLLEGGEGRGRLRGATPLLRFCITRRIPPKACGDIKFHVPCHPFSPLPMKDFLFPSQVHISKP